MPSGEPCAAIVDRNPRCLISSGTFWVRAIMGAAGSCPAAGTAAGPLTGAIIGGGVKTNSAAGPVTHISLGQRNGAFVKGMFTFDIQSLWPSKSATCDYGCALAARYDQTALP